MDVMSIYGINIYWFVLRNQVAETNWNFIYSISYLSSTQYIDMVTIDLDQFIEPSDMRRRSCTLNEEGRLANRFLKKKKKKKKNYWRL